MKKLAKFIRVVTVAPIAAIALVIGLLLLHPDAFASAGEVALAIGVLALFPLAAYPLERKFHLSKHQEGREGERNTAIIFSMIGYAIGIFLAFLLQVSALQKILYLTYFLSGALILVFNFGLGIRASGHMCGIAGPVAAMVYFGGWIYLVLALLLGGVVWASLYLKRHTIHELTAGFLIPIAALALSVIIIG